MSFRNKMQQFMYGRNGIDKLTHFIFAIYIIVLIGNWIFHSWILYSSVLLLLAIMVFRSFSKNIYKRRKENAIFIGLWKKTFDPLKRLKNRIRDRKTHRYRKCPHCKVVLRLPKKKGSHKVICPKCKKEFHVKI